MHKPASPVTLCHRARLAEGLGQLPPGQTRFSARDSKCSRTANSLDKAFWNATGPCWLIGRRAASLPGLRRACSSCSSVRHPAPFVLVWPQNGVVMSMQPRPWPDVPELTARMARSSSPKGNLAMRIREELGEVYADARVAAAFGVRSRPGISPGQLMMASVLQFSENLTDRQAAGAVRDRMTWKYALG